MEDIKVDFKLVIITICISAIVGTLIWLGFYIYESLTKDENEGVELFEEDMSLSKIENLGNKENELVDDNFYIQPNMDKKFEINNENHMEIPEEWGFMKFTSENGEATFGFPKEFNELIGINLETAVLEMSNWTEDGTYENFIQDFMDLIKNIAINEVVEYKTRTLNIGGKDFYVPMMETEKLNCTYFCLAKDGYAYCIQAIIPKKLYTEHWEQNLNKIFSTFTIL